MNKKEILFNKMNKITGNNRGIYFLIKGDEIVYVGKSEHDVFNRIRFHEKDPEKDFDSFTYEKYEDENVNLDTVETKYIRMFYPKYNKVISDHNNFSQLMDLNEIDFDVPNQDLFLKAFVINNKLYVDYSDVKQNLEVK